MSKFANKTFLKYSECPLGPMLEWISKDIRQNILFVNCRQLIDLKMRTKLSKKRKYLSTLKFHWLSEQDLFCRVSNHQECLLEPSPILKRSADSFENNYSPKFQIISLCFIFPSLDNSGCQIFSQFGFFSLDH